MATSPTSTDRWKALDFGPPASDLAEPDSPVLVDYLSGDRVALITLNRPHADNAITTEMGARLTEIVETIAVRPAVRVVVLTGAGERAFSVGSDLRQRKDMTKEDWLRQRQDFDRTLYTVRELRKPILAAVNGIAYGGGSVYALVVPPLIDRLAPRTVRRSPWGHTAVAGVLAPALVVGALAVKHAFEYADGSRLPG